MEISSHGISTRVHSPVPICRSDRNSSHPTTFVTADASSFKHIVQMLTGRSLETSSKQPPPTTALAAVKSPYSSRNFVIPAVKTAPCKKQQQGFKLFERRSSLIKHGRLLMISPLPAVADRRNALVSSRNPREIFSPRMLEFPPLALRPVTPLSADRDKDHFDKSSQSSAEEEEEKAIADKGFYLHPSPRDTEPQLLPLFPVTSPRV